MDKIYRKSSPLLQKAVQDFGQIIHSTPHGDRLPSEPELASRLGVSRTTMREVLSIFESQSLVVRRHGVGTFVFHPSERIESGLEVLDTVETLAEKSGLKMYCAVLKVLPRPAHEEEARILRLEPAARIIQVTRVMKVQDHPVAYMSDVIPEDLLSMEELGEGFDGSVLNLLLTRGDNLLASSYTTINAYLAKGDIAKALNVESGETLMRFISTVYGHKGEVVYLSDDFFLPSYFNFHVVRRVERFSLADPKGFRRFQGPHNL